MFDFTAYLWGLAAICAIMVLTWLLSLPKNDVSIVDSVWGLAFIAAALVYAIAVAEPGPRTALVLTLIVIWGLRLSIYITWRNWGEPEDRRYRKMREKRSHFAWQSLYVVFATQALLAWLVSISLLAAIGGQAPLNGLDYVGIGLWLVGFVFEAGGDYQLARFKANPNNEGKILDQGFWRYTRHPNYFGEFCQWWGFYLIALAAGGWWSIVSPLIMTILLLKVSGVTMTEESMKERHSDYQDYIDQTNAFFPGPRA